MHPLNSPSISHTDLSVLDLLQCQDRAKCKLEKQHLIFHLDIPHLILQLLVTTILLSFSLSSRSTLVLSHNPFFPRYTPALYTLYLSLPSPTLYPHPPDCSPIPILSCSHLSLPHHLVQFFSILSYQIPELPPFTFQPLLLPFPPPSELYLPIIPLFT